MSEFASVTKPNNPAFEVSANYINAIVDHAFEKPYTFIVRQTATRAEALYGYGSNNAGKLAFYSSDLTDTASMFQSIMDAINTLGGGSVFVRGYGTSLPYYLDAQIVLPDSGHLQLIGEGPEWTVFQKKTGSDNHMFRFTGAKTANAFFNRFQDFQMIGNPTGTNNCGFMLDSTSYGLIDSIWENIFIRDFEKDGMQVNIANCWNNKVVNCCIELCQRHGINVSAGSDIRIHNTKFLYNTTSGLVLAGTYANVQQCWFYYNYGRGIYVSNTGNGYNSIISNTFITNSQNNSNLYDHIYIDWSTKYLNILNNSFATGAGITRYAILMDNNGTKDHIVIKNNQLSSTAAYGTGIVNVGTGTNTNLIIEGNDGYNPLPKSATPFISNSLDLLRGTAASPTASTDYTVQICPIKFTTTNSSNNDATLTIDDKDGTLLWTLSGASLPITHPITIPRGYTLNWGAFTGTAPTVVACGT